MRARLRATTSAAFFVCSAALPVPGLAQADTPRGAAPAVTILYVASGPSDLPPTAATTPPNLLVPSIYRDTVESMLLRSPTFRAQCLRLRAARHLSVVLDSSPPLSWQRHVPASATIARLPNGRLEAVLHIMPSARLAELIAHEIEHVIEQLDGVDLERKARTKSTGVRSCECGTAAFETVRAIRIGEQVAAEVRERRSQ